MTYTVYLGSKCNLSCSYCHREEGEEYGVSDKLLEILKSADNIRFIGGEPTLYMDEIKKVVNNSKEGTRFTITTNGVNFDKYRDYFLKHKFFVCISYDGSNNLRGYDPFTKVIDYPYLGVSCTLFHGNTDFHKIIRDFSNKERIIGRYISFFPHIMHVTNPLNKKYALTYEDMDTIVEQYSEILKRAKIEYELIGVVNMRYRGVLFQLYKALHAGYQLGETYCTNRNSHKVDTEGNEYSCLYIRDESPKDIQFPNKCKHCDVYDMCGGACIKSVEHDIECYYYNKLYRKAKEYADFLNTIGVELS